MAYFYAQSGLIKDVTIGDAKITGELVGVTIKGDLIEGGDNQSRKACDPRSRRSLLQVEYERHGDDCRADRL